VTFLPHVRGSRSPSTLLTHCSFSEFVHDSKHLFSVLKVSVPPCPHPATRVADRVPSTASHPMPPSGSHTAGIDLEPCRLGRGSALSRRSGLAHPMHLFSFPSVAAAQVSCCLERRSLQLPSSFNGFCCGGPEGARMEGGGSEYI
jgi:hypothetical protein